jgi:hypothetical protein
MNLKFFFSLLITVCSILNGFYFFNFFNSKFFRLFFIFKVYAEITKNENLNKLEPAPVNFGLTANDSNMAEPAPKTFLEADTAD